MLLQADRISELQDDNERLTSAVVKLHAESEKQGSTKFVYGVIGVVLGVIAGALVTK